MEADSRRVMLCCSDKPLAALFRAKLTRLGADVCVDTSDAVPENAPDVIIAVTPSGDDIRRLLRCFPSAKLVTLHAHADGALSLSKDGIVKACRQAFLV